MTNAPDEPSLALGRLRDQLISDSTSGAISAVRPVLAENAYLFLEDDAHHLLGEVVLNAIAAALLQSFLVGLVLGMRGQAEKVGGDLAARLGQGIRYAVGGVADAMSAKSRADELEQDLDKSMTDVRGADQTISGNDLERYAVASEAALIMALRDRGYTAKAAGRLAAGVRRSAMAAVTS